MSKFTPFRGKELGWKPPTITVSGDELLPSEAQKILDANLGLVRQFYNAANAAHAAGTVEQSSRLMDGPGVKLRYLNQFGQERVEILVKPRGKGAPEEENPKTPWDWAVIDFEIPIFTHSYAAGWDGYSFSFLGAEMVTPTPLVLDTESSPTALWGAVWAESYQTLFSRESPPLLQWARASTAQQIGDALTESDHIERQSLLVDLRRFRTFKGELVFDIWGALDEMNPDYVRTSVGQVGYYTRAMGNQASPGQLTDPSTITASSGPLPPGTPSPYTNYATNPTQPVDFPTPYPQRGGGDETAPAVAAGDLTPFWSDLAGVTMITYLSQGQDEVTGAGPDIEWFFHENTIPYEYTPVYSWISSPVEVLASSTVTVRSAMFRGDPPWRWTDITNTPEGAASSLWVLGSQFPNRFSTSQIAEGVAIRYNPTGPQYSLLGQLRISPELGYAVFKAVA